MTLLDNAVRRMAGTQPSHSARLIPLAAAIGDLAMLAIAVFVAMIGRQELTFFDPRTDVVDFVSVAIVPLLVGWAAMLLAVGAYARDIFGAGTEEYKLVLKASLLSAGLVGIGCYLTGFPLSRGFFLLAFTIGTPLLLGWRFVFRRSIQHTRRHGHLRQGVIIAGNPRHVDEVAAVLRRESWLGYTVLGALTTLEAPDRGDPGGHPRPGLDHRRRRRHRGRRAPTSSSSPTARSPAPTTCAARCGTSRVTRSSASSSRASPTSRPSASRSARSPACRWSTSTPRARCTPSHWAKRTFDVLGSLGIMLLISPVWLATAVAVKFHDGGPVLFRQTRIGRDGRPFSCLKFRSMVIEAEQLRADLEVNHERSAVLFKMADDPRVTRPGRLIRRLSIDELPQLWNVLRGQMSLVGPRPPLPHEAARYGSDMSRRLRVRPGMTGLWQVSGRSDLSWDETVRLDLYYVDNWSMVQDLNILARTVSAVLSSRGAY